MTVGVVLGWVAAVVAAFLVGSVNPATLIARVRGTDLSVAGSGNPGATNAGRVLGRKWGVLVGVLDVLKGFVPTVIAAHWVGVPATAIAGGVSARSRVGTWASRVRRTSRLSTSSRARTISSCDIS